MTFASLPTVSPQRFAQGRTLAQWLAFLSSPENLDRPNNAGAAPRRDFTAAMRSRHEGHPLNEHQQAALKELAAMSNGPAKLLIIGEDWSSDCRRDMPTLVRVGEAAGMEVRIFIRDSAQGKEPSPYAATDAAGNGDLMHQFLNRKNGNVFQSIPVGAFFTKDMEYIYHFTEFAMIYQKDPFLAKLRQRHSGEGDAEYQKRTGEAFMDLQASPFFHIWACAAVDEIITNLWERLVL